MEDGYNAALGYRAFLKNLLFKKVPQKHKASYDRYCVGQNAQRLPFFYMLMALHRISSIMVYFVLYPTMFYMQAGRLVSTYSIYSVFYFISLGLASYGAKKFRSSLADNPEILRYSYFLAFAILVVDDFVTTEFFFGIFNPIRFLGGALLVATLPVLEKRAANLMIIAYLAANMISKIIFNYPMNAFLISSVYTALLAAVVMTMSMTFKTNHLKHFLESRRVAGQREILMKLSTTDALTKISNRRAFDEYVVRAWEDARKKGQHVSIMMMDVDRFKLYNDNFGHIVGDQCLVSIADTISAKFQRRGDMFARFGGEEFVAVMINEPGDDVLKFAESIRAAVEDLRITNPRNKQNPYITMSIGLASCIPKEGESPYSLIEKADTALYAAKQTGRNRVVPELAEISELETGDNYTNDPKAAGVRQSLARIKLEDGIRESVKGGFLGFEIYYQPLFSVSQKRFIGGEALLRWRNKEGKIVPPAIIIPALQRIGMFAEVEEWIFLNVAEQCAKWIKLTGFEDLVINVNMSASMAAKSELADETLHAIESAGISKKNILLEINEESVTAENQAQASPLKKLQEKGIRLAIDGFGTGYSSLGSLRDMPLRELKIDRSFVEGIETNISSRKFVAAIINLCHAMDFTVCVEGIERAGQARILIDLKADLLQGYYFSPPVPKDVMEQKFLIEMTCPEKFAQAYAEIAF
ncbi:MAG: EAL domain-containing protein [Clostridiales bacterium]|jgi:diguanylate cyclase (GGDEF)-like protein|nr:EAL domain-containing protein [Clostridiales bacterium]